MRVNRPFNPPIALPVPNLPQISSDSENGLELKGKITHPDDPSVPDLAIFAPHVFFNRTTNKQVSTLSMVAGPGGFTHRLTPFPTAEHEELADALATLMTAPWTLPIVTPELRSLCVLLGVEPRGYTFQEIKQALLDRM
jgi:hypothetical protein